MLPVLEGLTPDIFIYQKGKLKQQHKKKQSSVLWYFQNWHCNGELFNDGSFSYINTLNRSIHIKKHHKQIITSNLLKKKKKSKIPGKKRLFIRKKMSLTLKF